MCHLIFHFKLSYFNVKATLFLIVKSMLDAGHKPQPRSNEKQMLRCTEGLIHLQPQDGTCHIIINQKFKD